MGINIRIVDGAGRRRGVNLESCELLTAKGSEPVTIPPGSNGQVLQRATGAASGFAWATVGGGGPHATSHQNNGSDEISVAGLSGLLADPQTPAAHAHAQADVTGLVNALDGKAATAHSHAQADVTNLTSDLAGKAAAAHAHLPADVTGLDAALALKEATVNKGAANGYAGLDATGKVPAAQLPSSGSDPWTYIKLSGDFTTTSATAVDVTGLGFAPAANTDYEFRAVLMVRTNTATVNPRVGLAWPTGMTDGAAQIMESQAATGTPLFASGNPNAALLVAVGGLPNTTQSWPVSVRGIVRAGATPSGNVRVQLASETAGTTVTMKAGSYLARRVV